ncbi:MAG: hypothetical protein ACT4PQ_04455, partial [Betaproteobacteria bacterium]
CAESDLFNAKAAKVRKGKAGMPTSQRFDTVLQQPSDSTRHRTLVAVSTILRRLDATFLLLTGAVARADGDAVRKEVIAATAAWAEAFNARDAQRNRY